MGKKYDLTSATTPAELRKLMDDVPLDGKTDAVQGFFKSSAQEAPIEVLKEAVAIILEAADQAKKSMVQRIALKSLRSGFDKILKKDDQTVRNILEDVGNQTNLPGLMTAVARGASSTGRSA